MRENIFAMRRKALGLTQEQLAHKAGITRQVVTLTEQGLYHQPSSSLLDALATDPQDRTRLRLEYHSWIIERRRLNRDRFERVDLRGTANPHSAWEALKNQVNYPESLGTNFSAFCRALVYQKSLVREWEKKGTGVAGIMEALTQCGLSGENLERLI